MDKFDLGCATLAETESYIKSIGEAAFRAAQVYGWVHKRNAGSFEDMTDVPKELRRKLNDTAFFQGANICQKKTDSDGTIKYLLEIENNIIIETVYMNYRHGGAVCVSTQAGCPMGCAFCVSGGDGFTRNLTAGEMLAQVYTAARDTGKPVSNVTLMGCGEPLLNMESVLKFIHILNSEDGQNLGQRRITISTCGLTEKIRKLMNEKLQVTLAVSLHASNDEIRQKLMPVAKTNPMEGLLKACSEYGDKTKRRVTFEYAMINGVNDAPAHARELSDKLRRSLSHVNLIPVNPGLSKKFTPSSPKAIEGFKNILEERGVETTVRRSLGSGINAACGQLKHTITKGNQL